MAVADSSESPAAIGFPRLGGTHTGTGFGLDPYLFVILAAVDVGALIILILAQFINAGTEVYAGIFVNYGLLAVLMSAFIRIAALVQGGKPPNPDPKSWQNDPGRRGPNGTYIILALILATIGIILIFTNAYYLTNAPSHLSPGPDGPFRNTWQQTMFLAVGVLDTVQSPPLFVSWAGVAAVIQELTDLVFLGGVVTIALNRLNPR
jgi:hypothetical protein